MGLVGLRRVEHLAELLEAPRVPLAPAGGVDEHEVPVSELDMDVPTATDLWKSANWAEREAFEMFGFNFVGHLCLKRLLTHHEFVGHPLRKDYPLMGGQWCATTSDMTEELNEPR